MTKEEIVRGLKIHLDSSVNCDNCPLKDEIDCFKKLTLETIHLLEGTDDADKEV